MLGYARNRRAPGSHGAWAAPNQYTTLRPASIANADAAHAPTVFIGELHAARLADRLVRVGSDRGRRKRYAARGPSRGTERAGRNRGLLALDLLRTALDLL